MIRRLITAVCTVLALAAPPLAQAAEVNQAGAAELESVKGIGPALSGKILAARQQGPFKSWTDLLERVSGLGPGNAARLSQNGLTVAGAAYQQSAADKPAKEAAKETAKETAKQQDARKTAKAQG
jgi:competence protein ComEA